MAAVLTAVVDASLLLREVKILADPVLGLG